MKPPAWPQVSQEKLEGPSTSLPWKEVGLIGFQLSRALLEGVL